MRYLDPRNDLTFTEMEYYDKYWDNIRVEATLIKDAKAEGEAMGENRKNTENTKAMLTEGIQKEIIMRVTGLSSDEIDKL